MGKSKTTQKEKKCCTDKDKVLKFVKELRSVKCCDLSAEESQNILKMFSEYLETGLVKLVKSF